MSTGGRTVRIEDKTAVGPIEVDDEWASIGDVDPVLARRTKVVVARELEGSADPVVGAHIPDGRFGQLLSTETGRRWSV